MIQKYDTYQFVSASFWGNFYFYFYRKNMSGTN
jgi:hypothetical protein